MMESFRVLVCGGRNCLERDLIFRELDELLLKHGDDNLIIIHGDCETGADAWAEEWARINICPVERFPADWDKFGKAAGPIRNQQMIDTKPDVVLAFFGGNGTADTIRRAKKADITIIEWSE